MRKIEYNRVLEGGCPEIVEFFMVQVPCHRCGNRTAVQIDKDDEFDRAEAEYWQGQYDSLMGKVNTLISDTQHRTGFNPAKEVFMRMLCEIRDKFAKENPGRYGD